MWFILVVSFWVVHSMQRMQDVGVLMDSAGGVSVDRLLLDQTEMYSWTSMVGLFLSCISNTCVLSISSRNYSQYHKFCLILLKLAYINIDLQFFITFYIFYNNLNVASSRVYTPNCKYFYMSCLIVYHLHIFWKIFFRISLAIKRSHLSLIRTQST